MRKPPQRGSVSRRLPWTAAPSRVLLPEPAACWKPVTTTRKVAATASAPAWTFSAAMARASACWTHWSASVVTMPTDGLSNRRGLLSGCGAGLGLVGTPLDLLDALCGLLFDVINRGLQIGNAGLGSLQPGAQLLDPCGCLGLAQGGHLGGWSSPISSRAADRATGQMLAAAAPLMAVATLSGIGRGGGCGTVRGDLPLGPAGHFRRSRRREQRFGPVGDGCEVVVCVLFERARGCAVVRVVGVRDLGAMVAQLFERRDQVSNLR